ncbi:MAG: thioredoxin domain-containing protein [Candidatus Vogelbacteria bacterium]|nr:thioredoxin domain-containing protein [Candidatus Vogelbacteria bacterium]
MDTQNPTYVIAAAIIAAGALIAGAVYYRGLVPLPRQGAAATAPVNDTGQLENLRPIGTADHIRGNPKAPILLVEYSDTECPFCKRFHATLRDIQATYGEDTVAWAYRHFPLSIHTKAKTEAEALECAAELGGNSAFWKYADLLFERTPSNDGLDLTVLPQIATDIGLDVKLFADCVANERHSDRIEADAANAIATGGRGTPWTIAIGPGNTVTPINGSQPSDIVSSAIDMLLARKTKQ